MVDVLLDSTFLLPTLGVEVAQVRTKDLEVLKGLSRGVRFFGSYVSFVEILGKLARPRSAADQASVRVGLRSLLESGAYHWINPSVAALQLAFELRIKGHPDNIDNILYSIAADSGLLFLSLDGDLKRFLVRQGYDVKLMVDVKELQALTL